MDEDDFDNGEEQEASSIVPQQFKALRACLRCSLLKQFDQFYGFGCENCQFLGLRHNSQRVHECTTAYFEGMVALVDPDGSWVAKWQRIGTMVPGMYAIEVVGSLPDEDLEAMENDNAGPARRGRRENGGGSSSSSSRNRKDDNDDGDDDEKMDDGDDDIVEDDDQFS